MRAQTEIIKLTKLRVRQQSPFGEFLVQRGLITRFQLFRTLQLQDRIPGARLGACAVALGYAARDEIEQLYERFRRDPGSPDLESMITEAFHREPEIEIICEVA